MVRSLLSFSVADLFCGAGGFSEAVVQALGEDHVNLVALNHWPPAIETHNANHSGGELADLYDADPRAFVPDGTLDLLVASPTCTFHSRARGGKPISWDQRRGRMTPTQVRRWCKVLKPTRLIVENVPEFTDWGPISRATGKPRKDKKGKTFKGWIKGLEDLGYKVEWRLLTAADYGDATTRRRFFLMARLDGKPIVWPKPTHTQTGPFGKRFKRWRAAREIINWKLRGKSIFDRKKPLAAKTLLRIYAGVVRFGWPLVFRVKLALYMRSLGIAVPDLGASQGDMFDPALLVLRKHADMRSIDEPLPAVTAGGMHLGVVEPLVMRSDCQGGNGLNVRPASSPAFTPTTNGGLAVVEPFILPQHFGNPARSVDLPAPPPVAVDRTAVVEPFVFPANQGKERARGLRSVEDPLDTIVTKDFKALVEPFVFANRTNNVPKGLDGPLPTNTTTTGGGIGLIEPFMLSQGAGGAPRAVEDPVPTIPTEGAHALVAPYYGTGGAKTIEEPLPTVTTRDRFALVTPVTHDDASMRARSVEVPLPTITGANRGELAFVVGAFGERPGQTPRVRSVDEPVPTICAKGRVPLVHGFTAAELDMVDILLRMLEPAELAAAMGFPKRYRFTGNKTERTRMVGNAVAVNTARALVASLMADAA